MTLRERWRALPGDAQLGYAAVGCFALWCVLSVAIGPDLRLMMAGCLVYPVFALIALIIACRLVAGPPRLKRVLPLVLVCDCLGALVALTPHALVDLHLVARIYLAGGPDAVNDWGQKLIREHKEGDGRFIEPEPLPPRIRAHLQGRVRVDRGVRSSLPQVWVSFGGGHYPYGIVVYPTGTGPPAEWWQQILGWPPEVVVYHGD